MQRLSLVAIFIIVLSTLCIMLSLQTANVVLTEEIVIRYEATQPEVIDITKKLTELKNA